MLLSTVLKKNKDLFGLVIPSDYRTSKVISLDLTSNNPELKSFSMADTKKFSAYIDKKLKREKTKIGLGSYCEDRCIYDHSSLFSGCERRTIHLGIDLWINAGTKVLAPLDAKVHSFNNNKGKGDYGPTIIQEHRLEGTIFYTLYGHLSEKSLKGLNKGKIFKKGEIIGRVGNYPINGDWPPHLHFQIIGDILDKKGDYPGVSSNSDIKRFRNLCPDPNLILQIPELI